ncbi:MAG: RNA-binding S4 domain-containing protein [Fimbriimonadaceae bacterium]|nr:RNA-binding S4 domain-containing protein [Alphaproteobacteria bacterium]
MADVPGPEIQSQRIDKWLWHARIVRTRTLASDLSAAGKVRIDKRRVTRASQLVHSGNVITVPQGDRIRVLKVTGFTPRRVSASLVSVLYEDLTPAPAPDQTSRSANSGPKFRQGRDTGSGRPTKKERRQTDRLTRPQ